MVRIHPGASYEEDSMRIIGNSIHLDGNEVATAIDAYITAHRVHVSGPRTISADNKLLRDTDFLIYVDPS